MLGHLGSDASLLKRVNSFTWATRSATSFIYTAAIEDITVLVFTPSGTILLNNNIEASGLQKAEKPGDRSNENLTEMTDWPKLEIYVSSGSLQ